MLRVLLPALPAALARYVGVVGVAGLAALGGLLAAGEWRDAPGEPTFWVLAALCLLGELLPIRLPRRANTDEVTISAAFAFAVLIAYGPLPAAATYAAASLLADAVDRNHPFKALFNAGQFVLALVAAGGVLQLAVGPPGDAFHPSDLAGLLAAGATYFLVNQLLVGTGAALSTGRPVLATLRRDLGFQTWTSGTQLTLAPVLIAAADTHLLLVPLLFFPVLAIYFGGRQAVLNEHRALHDELTELPNRHLLGERLHDALATARETKGSLLVAFADLDDFKAVNDALGHHLGDRLLQAVARRLVEAVGQDATVARLGGDEFAIVVPGAGLADARATAQAVLERLEVSIELDSFSLDLRGSLGMAAFPEHGDSAEALTKAADVALYRAKEARTGWATYASDDDDRGFDRLALAEQLRRGIDRGELVLHYQPKLALRGGRPHGVEALVRWQHPFLGLIGPDGFLPLAEQTNLVKPLTRWVLEEALGQARAWLDVGLELRVAVNVSTRSLLDRQLPLLIEALLAKWELPPAVLQIEITETKIVADFGRARDVLHRLRAMGVGVAIDDFGTGYSSLAQLQQLPADEIKIDKSFVMDLTTNDNDEAIVRSTIGLGRNLGLDITAEGVESAEICARLTELGCDYAQGYHLGRPLPAELCEREIRRQLEGAQFASLALPPSLRRFSPRLVIGGEAE